MSQAEAAMQLEVTERTYRRWESGDPIPKQRDRDAIKRLFGIELDRDSNVVRERPAAAAAGQISGHDEFDHIKQQLHRVAKRYNIRRAANASPDELDRLRAELTINLKNAMEAGASDSTLLNDVVESIVEMMVIDSTPTAGDD